MRSSDLCYDEEHERALLREEGYDWAIADMIRMVSGYMRANHGYSDEKLVGMLVGMFKGHGVDWESWIPAMKSFFRDNPAMLNRIDELFPEEERR